MVVNRIRPTPLGTGGSLRVLAADDGVAIGEIGSVCVVILRKPVVQARIHLMASGLAQVVERSEGRAGLLCVVEAGYEPSEERLRSQFVSIVASHGNKVSCIATTIEASGFRAAVIRSLISGIGLLNRRSNVPPHAVFQHVSAAAGWMKASIPLSDDFPAAVEELRLQLVC